MKLERFVERECFGVYVGLYTKEDDRDVWEMVFVDSFWRICTTISLFFS